MKRRSILGLLALVPALAASKCEDKSSTPKPPPGIGPNDVPPAIDNPAEPDPRIRTVAITAWLEEEYGPYTVDVKAHDPVTNSDASHDSEIVASGTFTYILAYPQGHPVQVDAVMHAARPGSTRGYLALKDGKMNRRLTTMGGTNIVHISLTTAR